MNQPITVSIHDNFSFGNYTYFITVNGMIWKRKHGQADPNFLTQLNLPVFLTDMARIINKDQPGANADFRYWGAE